MVVGDLDLVGGGELLLGLRRVAGQARQPPQVRVRVADRSPGRWWFRRG